MSEDNILNLDEDSPISSIEDSGSSVLIDSVTGTLESQILEGARKLVDQRLEPLRTEVGLINNALQQVDHHLSEMVTPAFTDDYVSGILRIVRRTIDEEAAAVENRLRFEFEAERLQIEEAHEERLASLREEADDVTQGLMVQLAASREALSVAVRAIENAPPVVIPTPAHSTFKDFNDFETLKLAIEVINSQRTQADTLSELIRNAASFAPRVAFFVVRAGSANGWKAVGFDNGLSDTTVKSLSVPVQSDTLLGKALSGSDSPTSTPTSWIGTSADVSILGEYATPEPETAVAIPLVVRGRAAAVLYADPGPTTGTDAVTGLNISALETLMRVAGMAIELLPNRRGEPSPSVARGTTPLPRPISTPSPSQTPTTPPAASPAATEVVRTTKPSPDPAVFDSGAVEVEPAWKSEEPSTATKFEPAIAEPSPASVVPSIYNLSASSEPQLNEPTSFRPAFVAETGRLIPPPPTPVEPFVPVDSFVPVEPVVPFGIEPPPISISSPAILPSFDEATPNIPGRVTKPVPGVSSPQPFVPVPEPIPTPSTETEQRAHNDARRFARLLVSEIKLYNAAKVNEGRRSFDLYTRLVEEIERSRKVYDKRVSPAVATRFDYFYDELVQTLAEGDATKLGNGCPGPILK
jgi:hypothetical protein